MSDSEKLAKSVWRHYYRKLSKFTRGGKLSKHLDGYLPGDRNASKLGVLYRGTNKQEVEKLAQGRFKSMWGGWPERQNGVIVKPSRNATWVASNPRMAASFAKSQDARMLVIGQDVLRRKDKILTQQIGASTVTAPIRGGIGKKEVRGLLKGEEIVPPRWNTRGMKKWKPVPLGEIQKRQFSRIDTGRVEMSQAIGYEGGVPLTGKIARDRWVKKLRDEDLDRRDANLGRAGAAGAIAGALFPSKKAGLYARMGAGALAGSLGVLGIRQATKNTRDAYGERSRGAKRAELLPAAAGLTAAGVFTAKKLGLLKKLRMQSAERRVIALEKAEKRSKVGRAALVTGGAVVGGVLGARTLPRLLPKGRLVKEGESLLGKVVYNTQGVTTPAEILHVPGVGNVRAALRRKARGGSKVANTALKVDEWLGIPQRHYGVGVGSGRIAEVSKSRGRKIVPQESFGKTYVDDNGVLLKDKNLPRHAEGRAGTLDEKQVDAFNKRYETMQNDPRWKRANVCAAGDSNCEAYARGLANGKPVSRQIQAMRVGAGLGALAGGGAGYSIKRKKELSAIEGVVALEKPFEGYNAKRHARTGGLNDSFRKKYNREHGSNLKRPVTTEPSKLKLGSKAAKRRKSFCSRMSGVPGPTSKDGKLTPKGAALKRWNCSARLRQGSGVVELAASTATRKGLNPYVGATASGAISGASLGFLPTILRRGSTLKGALKAGGLGALASGAIVGGGALLGSKVLGAPRPDEQSAFTKRAAVGGALAGAGAGLLGGIALRKTRGGAKLLVSASKNWRPAQWLRKSPLAGSAALGLVGGAIAGGAQGADEGSQVDSLRSLKNDLKTDVKRAAMRLERKSQIGDLKFQKDWRDARRESRSEAIKDAMVGGGALAAGAGIGGGAGYFGWRAGQAARSVGNAVNEVGATVNTVNSAVKGVTKPRFVRSRQWMKKQMTTFPTFSKVMKKFRLENTEFGMKPVNPELVAALRRSAGEGLIKIGKPTKDMKALIATERARQPSWNRGLLNKVKSALALERAGRVHRFQLAVDGQYRRPLTEEQRQVRNALVGAAGVTGVAGGAVYAGMRSLKKADIAAAPMRAQMAADKEKWANAISKARDEANARAAFRSDIAKNLKANRVLARKPIEAAAEGARATTKARISEAMNLQKLSSASGGMKRGQRIAAAGALAALRKKYRFSAHEFDIPARVQATGRAGGWRNHLRGDAMIDANGNPVTMTLPAFVRSAHRDASQALRTAKRGGGLVTDLREVAVGTKTKKREWEKSWFKNAVTTGALTGGLLVGGTIYKKGGMIGAPKWAKTFRKVTDTSIDKARKLRTNAEDTIGRVMGMESRLKATIRMFEGPFGYQDYYSAPGWDLRDARGRSARVFAPGAKKRVRRPAEWHEKKDTQKKLIAGAGIAAALLAGGGGLYAGRKLGIKAGRAAMKAEEAADKIIKVKPSMWN